MAPGRGRGRVREILCTSVQHGPFVAEVSSRSCDELRIGLDTNDVESNLSQYAHWFRLRSAPHDENVPTGADVDEAIQTA